MTNEELKELQELREFKHMIMLERSINEVSKFKYKCQCWWCRLKRRLKWKLSFF